MGPAWVQRASEVKARRRVDESPGPGYNGSRLTVVEPRKPHVRLRTIMTLATGAATGAGMMYLLDPEHGPDRRREARRTALRQARHGAVAALVESRKRAEDVAVAAITGYRQAREEGSASQHVER